MQGSSWAEMVEDSGKPRGKKQERKEIKSGTGIEASAVLTDPNDLSHVLLKGRALFLRLSK